MNLIPRLVYGDLDLTAPPFAFGFGADLGSPETVYEIIESLLRDGEVVSATRKSNRQLTIPVVIEGADLGQVAQYEALLAIEADKPLNTLTFDPGDAFAPTTVFRTYAAQLTPTPRDEDWEEVGIRQFTLSIPAEPFTRSAAPVVADAVPDAVATDTTVIDACTSTAGWTTRPGDTLSVHAGAAVRSTRSSSPANLAPLFLERAGAASFTKPYVRVQWTASFNATIRLLADGQPCTAVATSGGYTWFDAPAAAAVLHLETSLGITGGSFTVWEVAQTNSTTIGTRREMVRLITVAGSARASGDLAVNHPTNGLGDVLAYTYPDLGAYSPSLTPWRTAGGTQTPGVSLVSGFREPLIAEPTYTIPQAALPAGTYWLLARVRHTAAGPLTLTWASDVASAHIEGAATVQIAAADTWQIVSIDAIQLPPVRLTATSDADVDVILSGPTGAELDMAWLFHTDGALTWVTAGTEQSVTIASPTPEVPTPMIYTGDHYAGDDAIGSWGEHHFQPPHATLYLVTTDTDDATAQLTHHPAWLTHAAS